MNDHRKITENHYRRRAACNTDTARKMDYPRSAPGRAGNFCRSQQGGQKLADTVALLTDFAGEICGGREIEPRTVLYFSLEDTLGRLQERLYQLVDAEEDPERLILQTESHGIGQGLEEQIVSFIHTYPDISLIVIDTLQKVRKTERNGSMYANGYRDIGALKELADKYGICISISKLCMRRNRARLAAGLWFPVVVSWVFNLGDGGLVFTMLCPSHGS